MAKGKGQEGAPASAGSAAPRRVRRSNALDFTYETARDELSKWIDGWRERLGCSGVMWDPETDEILGVRVSTYSPVPKAKLLEMDLKSGVTVHERLIDQAVAEYENGGAPPTPEVFRFLAARGRGVGQKRRGAPRVQSQVNAESQTKNQVQTARWYLINILGMPREKARRAAILRVAEWMDVDPRTVEKHSS